MLSDEEINARAAEMERTLGPSVAEWFREACMMEYGQEPRLALLWACRARELCRRAHWVMVQIEKSGKIPVPLF